MLKLYGSMFSKDKIDYLFADKDLLEIFNNDNMNWMQDLYQNLVGNCGLELIQTFIEIYRKDKEMNNRLCHDRSLCQAISANNFDAVRYLLAEFKTLLTDGCSVIEALVIAVRHDDLRIFLI